jgi:hypothetical protein
VHYLYLPFFQKALDWTRCLKAEPSKFGVIGYGKVNGVFQVLDPLLKLGDTNVVIPFLDKAKQDTFRLLGRQFSVDLKVDSIRTFVKDKIFGILSTIDSDSIPNHFKASLLQKAVSYFRWHLSVYSLPPSWLNESPSIYAIVKNGLEALDAKTRIFIFLPLDLVLMFLIFSVYFTNASFNKHIH